MKQMFFKLIFSGLLLAGTAIVATAQTTRVFYDNKGRVRFTIDYYGEKELPREIRAIVKPVYYDYVITAVQEVKADSKSVYYVSLQDSSKLITIRVVDGEMELVQSLNRFPGRSSESQHAF